MPRILLIVTSAVVTTLLLSWVLSLLRYWHWQAIIFGPPLLATVAAVRRREYWPVVDPSLSIFYVAPLLLIALFLLPQIAYLTPGPIVDWPAWLGWSVGVAVAATIGLVVAYRRHIDREWAVVGTFCVILLYSMWTLRTLNEVLPQPPAKCERARVVGSSPGGYRHGGPRLTLAPVGPYSGRSTHPVSWKTLIASGRDAAICIWTYSGALGWRWVEVGRCPVERTRALGGR